MLSLFTTTATLHPGAHLGLAPPLELPLARLAAGLVLCALIALGAALALRGRLHGAALTLFAPRLNLGLGAGERLRILESRRISAHGDVCRIASGGREYLVVVTAGGATVLQERDAAPPAGGAS